MQLVVGQALQRLQRQCAHSSHSLWESSGRSRPILRASSRAHLLILAVGEKPVGLRGGRRIGGDGPTRGRRALAGDEGQNLGLGIGPMRQFFAQFLATLFEQAQNFVAAQMADDGIVLHFACCGHSVSPWSNGNRGVEDRSIRVKAA